MYNSTMLRSVLLFSWAASLAGCTMLLSLGDKQCNQSADCVSAELGDMCVDHACVDSGKNPDEAGGPCSTQTQCAGTSTPRCLSGTCVTSEIYERWSCGAVPGATQSMVTYGFKVVDFLSKKTPANVQ